MTAQTKFSFDNLFANNAAPPRTITTAKRGKYDFAVAYPDPDSMPLDGLLEGLRQGLAEDGSDLALYYNSSGYLPLRELVVDKLARDRGIHVTPDDIVLGDGSGQPIHMIIETLINPGDVVVVADYFYVGTLSTMHRFGADVRGVACDDEGMIPEATEEVFRTAIAEGKKPKFIYTVPTFQNPQGWTMPLARRQALLDLAHKYEIAILEDDCYVDLRYDGQDVKSIYSLDDTGSVIYVGTFSKILAPGLRMGYMTAPRPMLERALGAKCGGAVNTFAALAVHRFASNNMYSHIEEINEIGRTKRDAMLGALDEHFGGTGATWSRPGGGLYLWLKMADGADIASIRDQVLDRVDVGYHPGTIFAADGQSGQNYARLCYGYNSPAEIGEGIGRLAEAFQHFGALKEG